MITQIKAEKSISFFFIQNTKEQTDSNYCAPSVWSVFFSQVVTIYSFGL